MRALSVRVALTGPAHLEIAKVSLQYHMQRNAALRTSYFVWCVARRTKQQSHVAVDGKGDNTISAQENELATND